MRENRLYGSEGGGTGTTGPSYPYHVSQRLLDPRVRGDDRRMEFIDSLFRGNDRGSESIDSLFRSSDSLSRREAKGQGTVRWQTLSPGRSA